MIRSFLAVATIAATLTHAAASSKSYLFSGECNGDDMVYRWSINGRPGAGGQSTPPVPTNTSKDPLYPNWPEPGAPGSSFIFPFAGDAITITGVELAIIQPVGTKLPDYNFFMAGNDFDADAMLFLTPPDRHAIHDLPPGTGFRFPGYAPGQSATKLSYLDLHGACEPNKHIEIMYTVYYVPGANDQIRQAPSQ